MRRKIESQKFSSKYNLWTNFQVRVKSNPVLDWFASLRPVIGLKIARKLLNQSGTKLKPCVPRSFAFFRPRGHLPVFLIGLKISYHPLNQSGGKTKNQVRLDY